RYSDENHLWVISNFDEVDQFLDVSWLFSIGISLGSDPKNLLTDRKIVLEGSQLKLSPYEHLWVTLS
ncbi:MAG: hypothetical protein WBB27_02165, partial [Maribacter sp.]